MSITIKKSFGETAECLSDKNYNRQRLSPEYRDVYYLHLSDIVAFLRLATKSKYGCVLDYGCGGSPYRALFDCHTYLRADYVQSSGIDILIGDDGLLNLENSSCDCVLSTQVLEHVKDPQKYLAEAYRVLRPGGRLILTTHGIWEDHGCPFDFRRWTRDGLAMEIESAGFNVEEIAKLTTRDRAKFFLFSSAFDSIAESRKNLLGIAVWLLRKSAFGTLKTRNRWIDLKYPNDKIVIDESERCEFYIALGVCAHKD